MVSATVGIYKNKVLIPAVALRDFDQNVGYNEEGFAPVTEEQVQEIMRKALRAPKKEKA